MGLKPGFPDFWLFDTRTGYTHVIEVKTAKGVLSESQKAWKADFDRSPTGRYAVVRSTNEASQVLVEWFGPRAKPVPFLTGEQVEAQKDLVLSKQDRDAIEAWRISKVGPDDRPAVPDKASWNKSLTGPKGNG
jgi:hypothetical protein